MRLTLKRRRGLAGFLFVLGFALGFLVLFLSPFIQAVIFSLSRLRITADGYALDFLGLANYHNALFVQAEFVQYFVEEIAGLVSQVPLILVFSLFVAVLLNQRFKGRLVARLIFFLPVIMGAGIISAMERQDYIMSVMQAGAESEGGLLTGMALRSFLLQLKLPEFGMGYILHAVDSIPVIIKASGIQILIFLAGLQSIPGAMYEAADVEGATPWERFWLVTLPMLSPLVLTNVVYSVIDFLTGRHSVLLRWIQDFIFRSDYGQGTAMAMMYFALVAVILGISIPLISRWVFYHD